jgi:(4-(4-[2-(gamma-L-glutamylamino)ethyl]phenoxymethyl)furan-2-yl)methanamine synthase
LIRDIAIFDRLAVTMTGELCDCFADRREGVLAILDAVASVAENRPIHIWTTRGFRNVESARSDPMSAASANWLALAALACRFAPERHGILVDIGSTTTDIVPLVAGRPAPRGLTDADRLRSLELVYSGVRRTPLCALLGGNVALEFFATTLDMNIVLGNIPEDSHDCGTADGKPATRPWAHGRLARLIGEDCNTCSPDDTRKLAAKALLRQVNRLAMAFDNVVRSMSAPPTTVILSGEGEFLGQMILGQQQSVRGARIVSLGQQLGAESSRVACAYAVAALAREMETTGCP